MELKTLMEIAFNLIYLVMISIILILMVGKYRKEIVTDRKAAAFFILAFVLLAVGDIFHLGFRTASVLHEGSGHYSMLAGRGSQITSVTMTGFYIVFLEVLYHCRNKRRDLPYLVFTVMLLARIVIVLLPANGWGTGYPPMLFSYLRNGLLTVPGLFIAIQLITADPYTESSQIRSYGILILISFAFYIPVILFAHRYPATGILMIPKTMAYIILAVIGYRRLFKIADKG